MDLLESGTEREARQLLAVRLPGSAVGAIAAGVAAVLGAGVVSAVGEQRAQERAAARPVVEVQVLDGSSSTVGGIARGAIALRLTNRGARPVDVELALAVQGLRVTRAQPDPVGRLAPRAGRDVRLAYVVPSCASLVLPGRLELVLRSGERTEQRVLPVVDPRVGRPSPDAIPLGACPPSSRSDPAQRSAATYSRVSSSTSRSVDGLSAAVVQ